jgi:hypothetical protein
MLSTGASPEGRLGKNVRGNIGMSDTLTVCLPTEGQEPSGQGRVLLTPERQKKT